VWVCVGFLKTSETFTANLPYGHNVANLRGFFPGQFVKIRVIRGNKETSKILTPIPCV